MPLFNAKTLKRYTLQAVAIPEDHALYLCEWVDLIRSGRIETIKETALHADFKTRIVEGVLGYVSAAKCADHTVTSEQTILKGSVDLALGHFNADQTQIIAPFELKGARTKNLDAIMPGRAKSPVQQAWEYATNIPGAKWVLVSNMVEIRLYGFGEGTQVYERFDLVKMTDPAEYARFMLLLSAQNLLTGKTGELLAESRREDKDITNALYNDYKALRDLLIFTIRQELPDLHPLDTISKAQKLLDRVLFTAFAEDTGLLPDRILEKACDTSNPFNPTPIWDNFKSLFTAINEGNLKLNIPPYNGGLFAADDVLDRLTIPDHVCKKFKSVGAYDFSSEVSVTVLGHIFEQSIADVERLQAHARGEEGEPEKKTGTSGRRKRDGVVYTPDYIARFIVEQTLGTHLKEIFVQTLKPFTHNPDEVEDSEILNYETLDSQPLKWKKKSAEREAWEAYRERLKTLRVVDPACGSGVFLVIAFDVMKMELTRVNEKIAALKGEENGNLHMGDFFDPDTEILTNNLFGVDVNAESIEIAKLSLWVKTARRGKRLDSLDDNLKVGDSLIEDSNYAYLAHGFTWASAFPQVFAEGGFDLVLGNPPYVRQEMLGAMKPYLEKRFEVYHGVGDLYCYFFERGINLLKEGGRLGYICSSTFFKTGSGKPLREFLRHKTQLEAVVDFGDLQVFEGVTTYPVIMTMQKTLPCPDHALQFWKINALPLKSFQQDFEANAAPYPQDALTTGSWELEHTTLKALRDKIRTGRKTLKQVYGTPFRGVLTGLNEAFVIDTATKERLCAQDPKSADLLKPFLEGKDLKRWRAESRGLWLIFIPKGWTKQHTNQNTEMDAWSWFRAQYPAIATHLAPFEKKAQKRTDQGDYWWELRACDYYEAFDQPKITYPHFNAERNFSVGHAGVFSNNKTYIIPTDDLSLLALLNSNVLWWDFKSRPTEMRGGFFEATTQHLANLPIPDVTPDQKAELAGLAQACQRAAEERYALEQALTRRIPDLLSTSKKAKLSTKLQAWWTFPDFAAFRAEVKKCLKVDIPLDERTQWETWITRDRAHIAQLTAQIRDFEAQINALVYTLFDLTPDEITLLEANI